MSQKKNYGGQSLKSVLEKRKYQRSCGLCKRNDKRTKLTYYVIVVPLVKNQILKIRISMFIQPQNGGGDLCKRNEKEIFVVEIKI